MGSEIQESAGLGRDMLNPTRDIDNQKSFVFDVDRRRLEFRRRRGHRVGKIGRDPS
jgi:hypothetical protein